MIALPDIPRGGYAVGVSGGGDSVALLLLVKERLPGLSLTVVHLDHELRGAESEADAAFVVGLAGRVGVPVVVGRRGELEAGQAGLPANPSARYRALRHALFRRVCAEGGLAGVLLAHHADDQAETVLQRLLRGAGGTGPAGMAGRAEVGGLVLIRPLLGVRREALRSYLRSRGEGWREDPSNASPVYLRNRLRGVLSRHEGLAGPLVELGEASGAWREWVRAAAPELPDAFPAAALHGVPGVLARQAVRQWLARQGVPVDELVPAVVERVLGQCLDAASPRAVGVPGNHIVRRRGGMISVVAARDSSSAVRAG